MFNVKTLIMSRGQTIIEAIVVISVVVILTTGLIAGTTTSLHAIQMGRTRMQASKLAEEGMEYLRNLRDKSWSDFYDRSNGLQKEYCFGSSFSLDVLDGTCQPNITSSDGTFTRSALFNWDTIDSKMKVTITVSYVDGTSKKDIILTSIFTQWK